MLELPHDFPHQSPEGYSYEVKPFKRNMVSIWLRHHYDYVYSDSSVYTIWGFYNNKQGCYYSPINSSKCGDKVELKDTTSYSAMKVHRNPLMAAFYE